MTDADFIADARKRTPTARRNTATGKLLEEALQRLERNQPYVDYAIECAVSELIDEAAPRPDNRWATAFDSRAGRLLVDAGRATLFQRDVDVYIYTLVDAEV